MSSLKCTTVLMDKWFDSLDEASIYNYISLSYPFLTQHNLNSKQSHVITHLTTSTAPARTLGSFPIMETLAVKEPSMLKTTHSVLGGTTVR